MVGKTNRSEHREADSFDLSWHDVRQPQEHFLIFKIKLHRGHPSLRSLFSFEATSEPEEKAPPGSGIRLNFPDPSNLFGSAMGRRRKKHTRPANAENRPVNKSNPVPTFQWGRTIRVTFPIAREFRIWCRDIDKIYDVRSAFRRNPKKPLPSRIYPAPS